MDGHLGHKIQGVYFVEKCLLWGGGNWLPQSRYLQTGGGGGGGNKWEL